MLKFYQNLHFLIFEQNFHAKNEGGDYSDNKGDE